MVLWMGGLGMLVIGSVVGGLDRVIGGGGGDRVIGCGGGDRVIGGGVWLFEVVGIGLVELLLMMIELVWAVKLVVKAWVILDQWKIFSLRLVLIITGLVIFMVRNGY